MRCILVVISLMITGCIQSTKVASKKDTQVTRTSEYQQEIDSLLREDKQNKKWEEIYLQEIATAQENDDRDAYKFFIVEYIKLPRIPIPEWMKQEPGYYPRKEAKQVLQIKFKILSE